MPRLPSNFSKLDALLRLDSFFKRMLDELHLRHKIGCLNQLRRRVAPGQVELPAGVEMVMPGDNVEMTVELIHSIALEEGTKFSIREGGRTVGAGSVTKIVE